VGRWKESKHRTAAERERSVDPTPKNPTHAMKWDGYWWGRVRGNDYNREIEIEGLSIRNSTCSIWDVDGVWLWLVKRLSVMLGCIRSDGWVKW
jgi:hypothetical protein